MARSRDRERRGRHTDLLVHTPICSCTHSGPRPCCRSSRWAVQAGASGAGPYTAGRRSGESTARHEIERGPGSPGPRGVALGCGRGGGRCGWLWLRARLAVAVWPVPAGAAGPGEPGPCTASASATPAVGRVAGRTADHAARRAAGPRRTWATGRAPDARRDDRPPGLGALRAGEPAQRAARRVGARAGGNRSELPGVSWWEGLFPAGSRPAPRGRALSRCGHPGAGSRLAGRGLVAWVRGGGLVAALGEDAGSPVAGAGPRGCRGGARTSTKPGEQPGQRVTRSRPVHADAAATRADSDE